MTIEHWSAYFVTVLVLMSTPGPSQLLMMSNSIENGFRRSMVTAAGDLSANFMQMVIAAAGLASILHTSREVFLSVKWAGVAYLVYLGVRLMFRRGKAQQGKLQRPRRSLRSLYMQGFLTSAANPKAVFFFAALFPQFIVLSEPALEQFAILSLTYMVVDGFFLAFYGRFAESVSRKLDQQIRPYLNKIAGAFLIGAAVLLGLKVVDER